MGREIVAGTLWELGLALVLVCLIWVQVGVADRIQALRHDVDRLRRKTRNVTPRDASDWEPE